MNAISPVVQLESTETPVVNWGKVVQEGLTAGAQISKMQADTKVDELRAQSMEMQMPVIAERAAVAQKSIMAEREADRLIGKTKRIELMAGKIKTAEETDILKGEEELANEKQKQLLTTLRTQFTSPDGPLFGVYVSAQNGLTRGDLASRDEGYDTLDSAIKSNPALGLIPQVAELQKKYFDTGEGITVVSNDPKNPNSKSISWTEARRLGSYDKTTMQMIAGQQLAERKAYEKTYNETAQSIAASGIPPEQVPAYVERVMSFKVKQKELNDTIVTRGLNLQKQIDGLITTQPDGTVKIDRAGALALRDLVLEDGDINQEQFSTVINSVTDPVLKEQMQLVFSRDNDAMENSVLDYLEKKFNAQDVAVQLRRATSVEGASAEIANSHADFKTFFNRAKGDGKLKRTTALTTAAVTIESYMKSVDGVLQRMDPSDKDARAPYLQSKVEFATILNELNPQLGLKYIDRDAPGYTEGVEKAEKIRKQLGNRLLFPATEQEQEEWIRTVYDTIQSSLPSGVSSKDVSDQFSQNFLSSIQTRRQLLGARITNTDETLQRVGEKTRVKVDPLNFRTK